MILQGLTGTASGFLQVVPLVMYYVKLFVFASTPRSIYKIKYTLRNVSWGTLFPGITLLAVISTFINSIPAYHTLWLTESHLSSYRLLDHFTHHQWSLVRILRSFLLSMEISLPVATWAAALAGNWWTVLPQGYSPRVCWLVSTANLSCSAVLPCSKR